VAEAWRRERVVTVGALCVAATTERCGTVADIKLRARRTMKIAINHSAKAAGLWPCAEARALLGILLADVETDISVAARDLGISDASFVRLRRALDRVAGARALLGASAEIECKEGASDAAVRAAVEFLASEWPEDYPAGAVEWLLAGT
jgi:hypothetical protein